MRNQKDINEIEISGECFPSLEWIDRIMERSLRCSFHRLNDDQIESCRDDVCRRTDRRNENSRSGDCPTSIPFVRVDQNRPGPCGNVEHRANRWKTNARSVTISSLFVCSSRSWGFLQGPWGVHSWQQSATSADEFARRQNSSLVDWSYWGKRKKNRWSIHKVE